MCTLSEGPPETVSGVTRMAARKKPPPVEWKVAAGHGGVARRRYKTFALCRKGLLVAGGHGLKERRQWALSSVSGPPCFGLCSFFARFFKKKSQVYWGHFGWFIGQKAACFFLRLTYRRDRPCRDPLKRDSGRYAITLI